MNATALPIPAHLRPFAFGDKVELRGMPHLGTARVLRCDFQPDGYTGTAWLVTIQWARGGQTTATSIRLAKV